MHSSDAGVLAWTHLGEVMSNSNLEVCGKAQPSFLQQTQAVKAGQTCSCCGFQGDGGALNCQKTTCPRVMFYLAGHGNKQLEKKK